MSQKSIGDKFMAFLKEHGTLKSQSQHMSMKDEAEMAFRFLNEYGEEGNVAGLKNVIDNYPHIATLQYKNFAIKNSLRAGNIDSISFLMNYVNIVNSEYQLLQGFAEGEANNPNWQRALEWLYVNQKDFLMQAYHYDRAETYNRMAHIIDFLEAMEAKEALSEGVPMSSKADSAIVSKI